MSYDDWKTSPPCPTCGAPNCLCDEPDPEAITFWIVVTGGGSAAVMVHRKAELEGLLEAGGQVEASADFEIDTAAMVWFESWCKENLGGPLVSFAAPATCTTCGADLPRAFAPCPATCPACGEHEGCGCTQGDCWDGGCP